jgi:Fur family transcriptional regulator, ferric uptake regulator
MKEENSYELIRSIFTRYMTDCKLRKTPERYAILECVYNFTGHFNAEIIHHKLVENFRVSLATVYNTFEHLEASKLIIRQQFGGKFTQYEKAFGSQTHNHLVCTSCERVKEFSDKQLRVSIQTKTFSKFDISHYSLYVYGTCSKCKEKIKQNQ